MREDKWRTHGAVNVKQALKISSQLSGWTKACRGLSARSLPHLSWYEIASSWHQCPNFSSKRIWILNQTPKHKKVTLDRWRGEPPQSALAALRGRLSSGSVLVKCNRPVKQGERGWLPWAVCHGGSREADVGGKRGWFVASKVICLRNNRGCSYLRLKGNVAVQKCTT